MNGDPKDDQELESLLESMTSEERDALLEEHRQLEKDLLRLADPLPPPDFVNKVMQKVAAAPTPAMAGKDIALALVITFGAMAAGAVTFFSHGAGLGGVGVGFAELFVNVQQLVMGCAGVLQAVWNTAAVPVAAALATMLVGSMAALKRLGTEAKVTS